MDSAYKLYNFQVNQYQSQSSAQNSQSRRFSRVEEEELLSNPPNYSMDLDGNKFGKGPRELSGAVDLISKFKLLPHHEFFCKKALPLSISETGYLNNVVGSREISKGEGMNLGQLLQGDSSSRGKKLHLNPFDLDLLMDAFRMRETAPVELPPVERGMLNVLAKPIGKSKDKKRKHKGHKIRDREKGKDRKQCKDHGNDKK